EFAAQGGGKYLLMQLADQGLPSRSHTVVSGVQRSLPWFTTGEIQCLFHSGLRVSAACSRPPSWWPACAWLLTTGRNFLVQTAMAFTLDPRWQNRGPPPDRVSSGVNG